MELLSTNEELEWNNLEMDNFKLMPFDDGCMFEIEEIKGDSYEIITNQVGIKTMKKKSKAAAKKTEKIAVPAKKTEKIPAVVKKTEKQNVQLLEPWKAFGLKMDFHRILKELKFESPTLIQEKTLRAAIMDRKDVVGIAETGSGKTLAYGLPILNRLHNAGDRKKVAGCRALILTPTRELAMQVCRHLKMLAVYSHVNVVPIVGGMSSQKQERLLSYYPEIVVGTPGRLWELIDSGNEHFRDLNRTLEFFVIDEADRMVETGNYQQVSKMVERLSRPVVVENVPEDSKDGMENVLEDSEDEMMNVPLVEANVVMLSDSIIKTMDEQMKQSIPEPLEEDVLVDGGDMEDTNISFAASLNKTHDDEEKIVDRVEITEPNSVQRQTFLFSATLSLSSDGRFSKKKGKKVKDNQVLLSVIKQVGMHGKPLVVDLTHEKNGIQKSKVTTVDMASRLPKGLVLSQLKCVDEERDLYLYYFLTQYQERTIIFLNSIPQVRRIAGLLSLLDFPVYALHAEMQQRQRLKKLDAFRKQDRGVLVCTDVAARGLDIQDVQYVVHYHIPRSTEIFIHRSGRTARAKQEGLSLSLVSAVDQTYHHQICNVLQMPNEFSQLPLDYSFLPPIKERLRCANKIYKHNSEDGKRQAANSWYAKMAEEADLALDDGLIMTENADEKEKSKKNMFKEKLMLQSLLAAPLRPVGSKRKFRELHKDFNGTLTANGEYQTQNARADIKKKKGAKRHRKR